MWGSTWKALKKWSHEDANVYVFAKKFSGIGIWNNIEPLISKAPRFVQLHSNGPNLTSNFILGWVLKPIEIFRSLSTFATLRSVILSHTPNEVYNEFFFYNI